MKCFVACAVTGLAILALSCDTAKPIGEPVACALNPLLRGGRTPDKTIALANGWPAWCAPYVSEAFMASLTPGKDDAFELCPASPRMVGLAVRFVFDRAITAAIPVAYTGVRDLPEYDGSMLYGRAIVPEEVECETPDRCLSDIVWGLPALGTHVYHMPGTTVAVASTTLPDAAGGCQQLVEAVVAVSAVVAAMPEPLTTVATVDVTLPSGYVSTGETWDQWWLREWEGALPNVRRYTGTLTDTTYIYVTRPESAPATPAFVVADTESVQGEEFTSARSGGRVSVVLQVPEDMLSGRAVIGNLICGAMLVRTSNDTDDHLTLDVRRQEAIELPSLGYRLLLSVVRRAKIETVCDAINAIGTEVVEPSEVSSDKGCGSDLWPVCY